MPCASADRTAPYAPTIWLDSRDLAQRFGHRHHNMLASIDLIISRCPALTDHVRFSTYEVMAGLGGKRRVRHALVDRIGFAMLAMTISTLRCEMVFETLMDFERAASPSDYNPKFGMA